MKTYWVSLNSLEDTVELRYFGTWVIKKSDVEARDAKIRELVEEALEKERKDENRVSSNGEYFLTIIKEIKRVLNGV